MRATEGLLVRWQNGQSHFPFSQWLTIAIAVLMVLSSGGLLLAQDVIDPVVNRQPGHTPLKAAQHAISRAKGAQPAGNR